VLLDLWMDRRFPGLIQVCGGHVLSSAIRLVGLLKRKSSVLILTGSSIE
jgi:hypothetical protein